MIDAMLSDMSGVDTTVYESYDNGDPTSGQPKAGTPWHRRLSPESWLFVIILGALAGLWALAGGFRKILS